MKNIIELSEHAMTDNDTIKQEAVAWLIRLDGDTPPTAAERQALAEWMARSPAHTRALEQANAFWADQALTQLNIPLGKPAQPSGNNTPEHSASSRPRRFGFDQPFAPRWALAATVLGLALLLQQLLPGSPALDSSNGLYATAIGEQQSYTLADGTRMQLNTQSRIRVVYNPQHRDIHLLQGEAHFEVAGNKALPFRVYAGDGRVQAVGTAFSVYLRQDTIDVLVTEGKVELAARDRAAAVSNPARQTPAPASVTAVPPLAQLGLLAEGQGASIMAQAASPEAIPEVKLMDSDTLKRRDAWRKGLVLFTGESLEDVVAEISRYTTVSIDIVDPAIKKLRIGGQFRLGDLQGMFDVLEANFGLQITLLAEDRVEISAVKYMEKNKQ